MSVTYSPVTGRAAGRAPVRGAAPSPLTPTRRVRHEVRDGLAVIAFSAVASTTVAVLLTLATAFAGQGR